MSNTSEVIENKGKISDGYHTFDELYAHRIALFILVIEMADVLQKASADKEKIVRVFKSKKHHDGSEYEGWFLCCLIYRDSLDEWKQISYHLPLSEWDNVNAVANEYAPLEWDGHTSQDCIERLNELTMLLKQ
jgi:hypothetical protein